MNPKGTQKCAAKRSEQSLTFLDRFSHLLMEAKTQDDLLDQSSSLFWDAFDPDALGIFIWVPNRGVMFRQVGLDLILKLMEPAPQSDRSSFLPSELDWSTPTVAVARLREHLESHFQHLYIVNLRTRDDQHGLLVLGSNKQEEIPDHLLEVISVLMGSAISLMNLEDQIRTDRLKFPEASPEPEFTSAIGVLSNQLENPLEVIRNYLYVIDREIRPVDPHKKYLDVIRQKLKIIHEVTGHLNDLAKRF